MFSTLALTMLSGVSYARSIEYSTKVGNFSAYEGGLYQSVLDEENGALYVSSALGRPPINDSNILKVNSDSLKVEVDYAGKHFNNKTGVLASYGIDLDQKNSRVWITNTRQNTVSFHSADDLSKVTTYPEDSILGPRDIYVDQKTGYAYASAAKSDVVIAFNPENTEGAEKTYNLTELTGQDFSTVMSIVVDEEKQILYTASMKSGKAVALNLEDGTANAIDLGDAQSPSGLALDTKRNHLFVANQKSNDTVVVDVGSGEILKTVSGTTGALNAIYDSVYDVVYVSCRTGHAVAVIDAEDLSEITKLDVSTPNQATVDSKGNVYVTDKNKTGPGLYKFTPKKSADNSTGNSTSPSPSTTTSAALADGAVSLSVPVAAGVVAAAALFI